MVGPPTGISETARRVVLRRFRLPASGAPSSTGLRQDAVSRCLQAVQLFEGMEQQSFLAVLSEVAALGQRTRRT